MSTALHQFRRNHPRAASRAKQVAKVLWWTLTLQLPSSLKEVARRRHATEIIADSGLFQAEWYLSCYPDVRAAGVDPMSHYILHGAREGRDPNPFFDSDWYLATNSDVRSSGLNPLAHYVRHGAAEGRNPSPLFDGRWYLATNADVRMAGLNPLAHYLAYGRKEGRPPSPVKARGSATVASRSKPAGLSKSAHPVLPAAPTSKYDVVILANIEWAARFQRPQQLATQFAANGHRVFYVIAYPNVPDDPSSTYEAAEVADNVLQIKLQQSCFFDRYAALLTGNTVQQAAAVIADLANDYRIADAAVHVHLPSWMELALALREKWLWRVIYDCMDDWHGFPGLGPALGGAEKILVRSADAVTVTGSVLEDKWRSSARRCALIRNGVNAPFFMKNCRPNDRFSFAGPVVGYYGALADWTDLDLLAQLADMNSRWQFVIAGDVFVPSLRGLDRKPNVKLLGLLPYEDMPLLLWHFDVCVIPFKLNAITHAVDPVKLYEYLSGGKPVVSVPLKEILIYDSLVSFAEGPREFSSAIAAALKDDTPDQLIARHSLASRNQWSDRYASFDALTVSLFPVVSIVILSYNNCDLTRLCIESILANTTHPAYEIIVVDNNSSDDTKEMLQALAAGHASIRLILNPENRGFAAANNQGLREARGDVLILMNNDVVVPRGWLRGMLRCLQDDKVGMAGPVTNTVGNEARIEVPYTDVADMDAFAHAHMMSHMDRQFDIGMLAMFCVAMRRDVLARVGHLDEAYGIGMFEDDDYANRVRRAGYRLVCTEESFVHHVGQAAFRTLHENNQYQALWDRNKTYYESKWGRWKPHVSRPR